MPILLLWALICWSATAAAQNPGVDTGTPERSLGRMDLQPASEPEPEAPAANAEPTPPAPLNEEALYRAAAERGEAWAQTKLAMLYLRPPTNRAREESAVGLLRRAAGQNDAEALFQLGALHMAGYGVGQSTERAFDYCRRSAELGHADAQYELAAMYALGRGTEVDEALALQWGRKAVAQNHSKAKYSIGRMLLIGEDPAQQTEAVQLLEQAAGDDIAEAALLLAEAYADGLHGLTVNRTKAIELLRPVAERGHPEAGQLMERLQSSPD
jgi:TPR repeat protein